MVIRRCRANLSVAAFSEAFTFSAPERLPNKVRVPRQFGGLGLRPWRSMLLVVIEPAPQPGLGKLQIVPHDMHGQAERFGGLFRAHSSEVPHLDQARKLLVFGRKGIESEIEVQKLHQLYSGFAFHLHAGRSRNGRVTGALRGRARPCVVDKDLPHHPRRHRQEMHPVAESPPVIAYQFQVRFMYQRGRLQRMVGSFSPQFAGGDSAQLRIKRGHQIVERRLISRTQPLEQFRDARRHADQRTIMTPSA